MPGAQCTHSLACEIKKAHESSHHGHTGITRHSPRNGFTAYALLSPATNSFCHRHPRIKVLSARSGRRASANLAPATGARTTRFCRTQKAPIILHAAHRSRGSSRPAIAVAPDAFTSTASRPALVTTRDRPSGGTRQRISELIWVAGKQKYFCKRGLT